MLEKELEDSVDAIVTGAWGEVPVGIVVPETTDIGLGNVGRELDVTMLYADLADSTELALYDRQIAAEVYKAYSLGTTKIIKAQGGKIRSFDGDRVMGIFIGGSKNTCAAMTALKINWFFTYVLRPKFNAFYARLLTDSINLAQTVGIDTGLVRVARAGVRNDNDLIWVGKAPNIAAKLSSIREPSMSSYITKSVYDTLGPNGKLFNGVDMWEVRTWQAGKVYGAETVYRSSWWLKPSYLQGVCS